MPARLLDTNIVSYMVKRHTLLARYQPHITGYDLGISFQTRAELTHGAVSARWGSASAGPAGSRRRTNGRPPLRRPSL